MKNFNQISRLLPYFLLILCFSVRSNATNVTLMLTDQHTALIPGSHFEVFASPTQTVNQGGTISLEPGTYTVVVAPGLLGISQSNHLYRFETITVGSNDVTINFEWKTAFFNVSILNQNFTHLTNSIIGMYFADLQSGQTVELPVTEDSSHPAPMGEAANGYRIKLFPSLNGYAQGIHLFRDELPLELTEQGLDYDFEWKTANFKLTLVDQAYNPLQNSLIGLFFMDLTSGQSIELPVTVDPDHAEVQGTYALGYPNRLFPSLNGFQQGGTLYRDNSPIALNEQGVDLLVEWKTASFRVTIVNQLGNPLINSIIGLFFTDLVSGQSIVLPVTYDEDHETVQGTYANGYFNRLFPSLNGYAQGGLLYRDNSPIALNEQGVDLLVEWKTASLKATIVNQFSNPLVNSIIGLFFIDLVSGQSIVLPVTYDDDHETVQGTYALGYFNRLFPSLNGLAQGGSLYRDDPPIELDVQGVDLQIEWKTAPLTTIVVDESDEPIDSTLVSIVSFDLNNGAAIVMPVTEDPSHSTVQGPYSIGYPTKVFVGINNHKQGSSLYQQYPPVELIANGVIYQLIWKTFKGNLYLVDVNENEVCIGKLEHIFIQNFESGSQISLPITDPVVYPDLLGFYADGYMGIHLQVDESNPYAGPFTFSINEAGEITPAYVSINGQLYGLRFDISPENRADADGDGVKACDGDCDDSNPAAYPGATEVCFNNMDDNCDGLVDENCSTPLIVEAGNCIVIYFGYDPMECATLSAEASGGMAPYSYVWSHGCHVGNAIVCPSTTTNYFVTVTDALGNTATDHVTVIVKNVVCGNPNNPKVLVCHNGHQLCLPVPAVDNHLGHGDQIGQCGTTNPCAVDRDDSSNNQKLNENEKYPAIIVEPNPAYHWVTVKLPAYLGSEIDLMVTNTFGQVLHKQHISEVTEEPILLDFSLFRFQDGLYFISAVHLGKASTVKLQVLRY